jgi:hypothetical protein
MSLSGTYSGLANCFTALQDQGSSTIWDQDGRRWPAKVITPSIRRRISSGKAFYIWHERWGHDSYRGHTAKEPTK